MKTRVALVLVALAIGTAIGHVLNVLDSREDDIAATEARVEKLRQRGAL